MKARSVLIWAVLLLGTAAFANPGRELTKEGRYWVGTIQETYRVDKTGSLIVENVQGKVNVSAWAKNEVSIHEIRKMDIYTKSEAEAAMEDKTGYSRQGNTIHIEGSEFSRDWIHSSFDIQVPAGFDCTIKTRGGETSIEGVDGNVSVSTGGGEIELRNLGGVVTARTGGGEVMIENVRNKVDVSTGGGEVDIRGAKGQVDVKTGGGEVNVENTDGDLTVSTGGGEISIENVKGNLTVRTGGGEISANNLGGSVVASTGGGDMELTGIQGSLKASTGGGKVTATITLSDFTKKHDVEIRTGDGDINLTVPAKLPATVSAKIRTSRRNWEEFSISSDFPLEIKTDDVENKRVITAKGGINGGGDLILLETGGGNIRILKGLK